MKKIVVIVISLLIISVLPVFAQADVGSIGVGIIGMNPFAQEEGVPFLGNALWGLQGRLKMTDNFGFNMDILFLGRVYWTVPFGSENIPWEWIHPYSFGATDWYHEEYWVNLDIGVYFPLGFVQPYFQIGPSFMVAVPNDDPLISFNDAFQNAFLWWYQSEGLKLGYNLKFGIDFFISRFFSLSFEITYLVDRPDKFFYYVFNVDPDITDGEYFGWEYLGRKGYAGLTLLFWL